MVLYLQRFLQQIFNQFADQKKLYVPRVEDRNSNMRMLRISNVNDLIENSMHILEPSLVDSDGKQCEDGITFLYLLIYFPVPGMRYML